MAPGNRRLLLVGAAGSIFTGRGLWTSGRDMFLVASGVAAAF